MNEKKLIYCLLILITAFAFVIRIYRIDSVPPSLTWDEVDVGYNAWTIANHGRDEYGNLFPLYFRSFGDDKQPVHVYTTAIFTKILGLSEFSTRLPSAIFGVLNVLVIFFLAKSFFNSSLIGLLSALFLAISPQNIHFSRFNHEANFALFFFMLGLLFFNKRNLSLSALSFITSMLSYPASKLVVPILVFTLVLLNINTVIRNKTKLATTVFILFAFLILNIYQPRLLGLARYNQTAQGNKEIENTKLFQKTHNYLLGRINLITTQYLWHFDPQFLFISGDKNSRLSSQGSGEFYKIDALFLLFGIVHLLYKRSKKTFFILIWALVGPLPASLVAEAPHAARSLFIMGSWHIISALGFYTIINLFRKNLLKYVVVFILLIILTFSLSKYLNHYFNEFSVRYAIDWQYGMKQVASYVNEHKEYDHVYTTAVRSQPYIFFLYYLKTPLPDYLETVIYNNSQDRSSNNVSAFNRFSFGGWNPIENIALKRVLYVLSPSEYDGLNHRSDFDIKNIIFYPNGTTAFYLVTLK